MGNNDSVRCRRCNRVLTDPDARHRGYGIACWKTHLNEQQNKNSLFPLSGKEDSGQICH